VPDCWSVRPNRTVAAEVATLPLYPGWIGGGAGSTSSVPGHAQGRGRLALSLAGRRAPHDRSSLRHQGCDAADHEQTGSRLLRDQVRRNGPATKGADARVTRSC
jgi:hypothetical protein